MSEIAELKVTLNTVVQKLESIQSENKETLDTLVVRVKELEEKSLIEDDSEDKKSEPKCTTTGTTGTEKLFKSKAIFRSTRGTDPTPTAPSSSAEEISFQGPVENSSEAWRANFESIRETLAKLRLPNELKLNDNKSGITGKDRETAAILSRIGKFSETTLKLIGEIQQNYDKAEYVAVCLDNLYVTNVALVKYLQEESSLV